MIIKAIYDMLKTSVTTNTSFTAASPDLYAENMTTSVASELEPVALLERLNTLVTTNYPTLWILESLTAN